VGVASFRQHGSGAARIRDMHAASSPLQTKRQHRSPAVPPWPPPVGSKRDRRDRPPNLLNLLDHRATPASFDLGELAADAPNSQRALVGGCGGVFRPARGSRSAGTTCPCCTTFAHCCRYPLARGHWPWRRQRQQPRCGRRPRQSASGRTGARDDQCLHAGRCASSRARPALKAGVGAAMGDPGGVRARRRRRRRHRAANDDRPGLLPSATNVAAFTNGWDHWALMRLGLCAGPATSSSRPPERNPSARWITDKRARAYC